MIDFCFIIINGSFRLDDSNNKSSYIMREGNFIGETKCLLYNKPSSTTVTS